MVPVARKNLLADRIRLLVSIGGVTFAVILVLVVRSLYQGYYQGIGAFVDAMPVDAWVTQTGAGGLLYSSQLPLDTGLQVSQVPGVRGVVGVDRQRLRLDHDGQTIDALAMAFNVPDSAATAVGLAIPPPGQIALDATTRHKYGLKDGDTVSLRGRQLTIAAGNSSAIVGLSGLVVLSWSDGQVLLGTPGYVSAWMVSVAPGVSVSGVIASINSLGPGMQAVTRDAFASADRSQVSDTFLPIITVLLIVSFLVGTAVVGITIYTATVERLREFGVLKAIGASTPLLFWIILEQSVLVCTAGFVAGVPLTAVVNRVAKSFVPEFITLMRWQDAALAFGVVLAMALMASIIPIRRIAVLDPAEVFRG